MTQEMHARGNFLYQSIKGKHIYVEADIQILTDCLLFYSTELAVNHSTDEVKYFV